MKKIKKMIETLKYDDSLRHEFIITLVLAAASIVSWIIFF